MEFKTRKLEEYPLSCDFDREKAIALHSLIQDYRDRILIDTELQDLILSRYGSIEESIVSYTQIQVAFNGKKVGVHLSALEALIDLSTRPRVINFDTHIHPPETDVLTSEGHDANLVENFQCG